MNKRKKKRKRAHPASTQSKSSIQSIFEQSAQGRSTGHPTTFVQIGRGFYPTNQSGYGLFDGILRLAKPLINSFLRPVAATAASSFFDNVARGDKVSSAGRRAVSSGARVARNAIVKRARYQDAEEEDDDDDDADFDQPRRRRAPARKRVKSAKRGKNTRKRGRASRGEKTNF